MIAKATIWFFESIIQQLPEDVSKFTLLIDFSPPNNGTDFALMRNFSKIFQVRSPSSRLRPIEADWGSILRQAVYAERVYQIIVHPASVLFWSLWSVLRVFMDPTTAQKVKPIVFLYGLRELVDDEFIPKSLVRPTLDLQTLIGVRIIVLFSPFF